MTYGDTPLFPNGDTKATNYAKGLTKREYFAAMAMQGLATAGWDASLQEKSEQIGSNISEAIATYAVDLADALIKALNDEK